VTLRLGIAGPKAGVALFPCQEKAGVEWGLKPIIGATREQLLSTVASGDYHELPIIALEELAEPLDRIDLLHVDIQGGEAGLITSCMEILCEKVAYLVVGTHSRQIEGLILEAMLENDWVLEIERPAILDLDIGGPRVTVDGVQGWRNPNLTTDSRL